MKGFISSMVLLQICFIFTILLMAPNVSAGWDIDPEISGFGRRLLPQIINVPKFNPKVASLSVKGAKRMGVQGRG
ncbi:hypothetical protein P3S68_002998 [Capsicum galapagoense]